jgi:hypothetical protein
MPARQTPTKNLESAPVATPTVTQAKQALKKAATIALTTKIVPAR